MDPQASFPKSKKSKLQIQVFSSNPTNKDLQIS